MSDLPSSVFSESPLSATEGRVLGCLIEKQFATPEVYPLTLNALVLACNQKTSREPLMNLAPGAVGQALRSLEGRGLARLMMGSRADRWEQRADKTLELVAGQVVLVGLLLLRGPQTLSELLSRSARLHEFEDLDAVQHSLERLISRGFAQHLGRQVGQREDRYTHALGDPADLQALRLVLPMLWSALTRHYQLAAQLPGTVQTHHLQHKAEDKTHLQVQCTLNNFASSLLTKRERDVLLYLLRGYSSALTAEKLNTSDGTVKIHRKNIYRKLDIGSQAELFSLFINCIPFAEPDETSDPLQFYQQSQQSPVFATAPKR